MKAMILAAGEGRRMRPLTATAPKVLLEVAGQSLLERHVGRLRQAGVTDLVINTFHCGDQIEDRLGNGDSRGVSIEYSREDNLLETGGGITRALPLLGEAPFLLVSADVYTDFDFSLLINRRLDKELGRLLLVANPEHNRLGDFSLATNGLLLRTSQNDVGLTYSGISILSPELFDGCVIRPFPLRELLFEALDEGRLTGEFYPGFWTDVGTPKRLWELQSLYDNDAV